MVEQAKDLFAEFETTGAISRKTFISYEETIDILTDVMSEFVNLEKTEVEHSQQFALKTIEQAEYWVFGLGGFTLMIAMGLGLYLAGRISKPLEQLNKAAAEIGKGEYGSPVEVESINEIGTLANTFNTMAGQIKERTESLVKSNEERQQLVYELKQANRELEERNVEMEQFTFRVSHDLRAPLVNIKGFAGELQESLDSLDSTLNDALPGLEKKLRNTVNPIINKDIPESLDFINSSVTRMDQLINAILKLARLEKRVMDFQPLKMNELVQSTLKTLAHQIEKRKIKVTVSNLPQVMADRTSMDQIMGNLLSNAINYLDGKRPGVIEISADCKDLWRVLRSATTAAALPKGTRKEYFKSSAAPESRMCPEKASGWPMSNPSSAATKAASGAIRRWAKAPPFYLPFPIICHQGTPNDSTWTCHPASCRG